jgi:hypothetical protein
METLTLAQTRSWWWKQQGLGTPSKGPLVERLMSPGWLRTLGGADVYLAARARVPGMTRVELDALVESGELRVVPAARGCIYLVRASVVGDLMALNADGWRKDHEKQLAKLGSSFAKLEPLAKSVLATLSAPMTTDALRKALPAGSIPSFGDAGKKIGLSSPLPLVLRMLEFDGKVERTLDGGRLDSERYLWRTAKWKVRKASKLPLATAVAAFIDSAAPFTLEQLRCWTVRAKRDLEPIVADLAEPVMVEGMGAAWAPKSVIAGAKKVPAASGIALLAAEDNYLVSHGLGLVTDPRHHAIDVDAWGASKAQPIGEAGHIQSRSIVIDGLVAGYWEVSPKTKTGVWWTFAPAPKGIESKLDELTNDAAKFLLDDIGHPRQFSLDSTDEVQKRADALVKLRKK